MNLIQQKQIQGLSSTFDTLSGQIGATGAFIWGLMSGDSVFSGEKTFTGEAVFNTGVKIYGPLVVYNKGTFSEIGINLPSQTGDGFTGFFPEEGLHIREKNVLVSSGDLHVSGDGTNGGNIYVSGTLGEKAQLVPHWNWRGTSGPYGLYYSGQGVGGLPGDGKVFIGFDTIDHSPTFTERTLNVSGDSNFLGDSYNSGSLTLQGDSVSLTVGLGSSGLNYDYTTQALGLGTSSPRANIESTGDIMAGTGYFSGLYSHGYKTQTQGYVVVSADYTGNGYIPVILVNSSSSSVTVNIGRPNFDSLSEYTGICNAYNIVDIGGDSVTYPITITGSGAQVDGELYTTLSRNYGSVELFTDGYNWFSTDRDKTFKFSSPPSLKTSPGTSGEMALGDSSVADGAYLYVCTGASAWGRTDISGWS